MGSWGGEDSQQPGRTQRGGRLWNKWGRQCDSQQTPWPPIHAQIHWKERQGEAKQTAQPKAPAWGNKASNL